MPPRKGFRPLSSSVSSVNVSGLDGQAWEVARLAQEVRTVKRALGMALAELCRINSGCPSDVNGEIWEAFVEMGGDCDALSRQIDFMSQMKSAASQAAEGDSR